MRHLILCSFALALVFTASGCPAPTTGCDEGCDDGISCTVDACDEAAGTCRHTPDNGACNAPEVCDTTEGCTLPSGACTEDAACDDGNACTSDTCNLSQGTCVHGILVGQSCDDGDACTDGDSCQVSGGCQGTAMQCEDGDPCTADSCDPATLGCVSVPAAGASCDDGDACTRGDICQADGSCAGPTGVDCDDGDPCTADACDATTGCSHQPSIGGACDDGDACTLGTTCQADGSCGGGTGPNCDDGDPCTADGCDAAGNCTHTPAAGAACDDGNFCTTATVCQADGACGGGTSVDCDRGNGCETFSCDPASGCVYQPATGAACDDGDACTSGSTCQADATCGGGAGVSCDDGDPCTADACNVSTGGCEYTVLPGNPCDDGDSCTSSDVCDASGACGGTTRDCSTGDACNVGSCDPATGSCVQTPAQAGTSCDADGDGCTVDDVCDDAGTCVSGALVDCSDGDACTIDSCTNTGATTYTCENPSSGVCSTVDWCRLQWPLDLVDVQEGTSTDFYGRVYIAGVTDVSDAVDASASLVAELGWGPDGSDPATAGTWVWNTASANAAWNATTAGEPNNDEYQVTVGLPAAAGSPYDFAFRFSNDYGQTWLYCDRATGTLGEDGAENGYQVANAGQLTTVP